MGKIAYLVSLVIALTVLSSHGALAKDSIVVNCFGGTFEQGWRKNIIEPFQKTTGVEVLVETALSAPALAKMRAQKDNPQIDCFIMDDLVAIQAAQEGLYDKLNFKNIPNSKDVMPGLSDRIKRVFGTLDLVLPSHYGNGLVVYNKKHVKNISSWDDFLKPEYKGKILLPDVSAGTISYLFIVNMALIKGGSLDDLRPGIEFIKKMKPNVLTYFSNHDQVSQLMASEEAWISVQPTERIFTNIRKGLPLAAAVPKEGVTEFVGVLGVPKGIAPKKKELAEKYINQCLDPASNKANAEENFIGPPTRQGLEKLNPDVKNALKRPENILKFDLIKFNEAKPKMVEIWNKEITSK
jgi:putative spermidine/putrescine transport system substrate-binding protein